MNKQHEQQHEQHEQQEHRGNLPIDFVENAN